MSVIWEAKEIGISLLPGFPFEHLPAGLEDKVRIVFQGKIPGVEVCGVIGSVPLNNGDTLQISPKVGYMNFFRMLLTVEGLYSGTNKDFKDDVAYSFNQEPSFSALIYKRFLRELAFVSSESKLFSRNKISRSGDFSYGRINPMRTALRLRFHIEKPVISSYKERQYDISENRVLAAAAMKVFKCHPVDNDFRPLVIHWQNYYRHETLLEDLEVINSRLLRRFYDGPRGYYANALLLAKMILGQSGFSQGSLSEVIGEAILINSANLFECYVRSILTSSLSPMGLVVKKGGTPPQYLYSDNGYCLTPDICVSHHGKYLAIGDAKYKMPDAGDHYQMLAYMQAYGTKNGFFLCPSYSSELAISPLRKTKSGYSVFQIGLPLDNLDKTEEVIRKITSFVPF